MTGMTRWVTRLAVAVFLMLSLTGCPGIIGDSITNQSREHFGGWGVSAVDGRYLRGSEDIVSISSGNETTVIALGSNDVKAQPPYSILEFWRDIQIVRDAAQPTTCLAWVDVSVRGSTVYFPNWPTQSLAFNAVLPSVVGGESRVIRWSTHSAQRPEWFTSDGIHLTAEGEVAYASFVRAEAERICPGLT